MEKLPETEIAEVFALWMAARGWQLYPEVVVKGFGGRPDFVGTKETLCCAVECKATLNWSVIEQLYRWKSDWRTFIPHLAYAVVGSSSGGMASNALKRDFLKQHRFGLIVITKHHGFFDDPGKTVVRHDRCYHKGSLYMISEAIKPRLLEGSRTTAHKLISQLHEDMNIATPGAKGGATEYMTPFKRTMEKVRLVLRPGTEMHINSVLEGVNNLGGHHYGSDASFKQCVPQFILKFGLAKQSRNYGPWFIRPKLKRRPL